MLLLTEGRAGEIWESSNKQCPVGYRGALDTEVLLHFLLFRVSACCFLRVSSTSRSLLSHFLLFRVSACCLLRVSSTSLVPFYYRNIPFFVCHPYLRFTDVCVLHNSLDSLLTVSNTVWHVCCGFRPRSLHQQLDNIRCRLSERQF